MRSLFLFGATSDKPHDQFVISLEDPIIRFVPWRFASPADFWEYRQRNQESTIVQVPGYRILLVAEILVRHPAHIGGKSFQRLQAFSQLLEAADAARFYLTHKIQPNAQKFNRYKEAE